jgi:hypothetical protein
MTTVASCARSVNDLHPTVLRNPPPFPLSTCRCDVKSYARVTSRFSLLNPLSYRENKCNSTSKLIISEEGLGPSNTEQLCITPSILWYFPLKKQTKSLSEMAWIILSRHRLRFERCNVIVLWYTWLLFKLRTVRQKDHSIPAKVNRICVLQSDRIDCGAHAASCSVGTTVSYSGIKRRDRDAGPTPRLSEIKNEWRYTSFFSYTIMVAKAHLYRCN